MIDRFPYRSAVVALLASTATASPAQTAPPGDTITVTGSRLSPEAVHQRATDFVRATGIAAGDVPAARRTEPVCPRVVGLTDRAAAALVEATLRGIAADAGIAAAPAPCAPNIAVVFASDGATMVRAMAARSFRPFAQLRPAAVAELKTGGAPIRWWYASEVRDRDGIAATATSPPPGLLGGAEGGGSPLPAGEDTSFVQHYSTSLIGTGDIRVLRAATVVDVARTDGLPLSAVASFAAMVALAEIRPGAAPPASILGLFAGGGVKRAPTAWDRAFLRALYRLPLDRTAVRQRERLVADLVTAAQ